VRQDTAQSDTMITLTLPTMTCGHCVRTVTETVHKVDAQATLTIDLPTHRVQITSARPAAAFTAALAEQGYAPA
jgi:copper chaperone